MVPQNLQTHMLRVAALSQIITENWKGKEIAKKEVIQACLFHDIAKPMNFDLEKQAQFGMSPKEIEKLRLLQTRIKTDYGNDEHSATIKIYQEIGLSPKTVQIVSNLEWKYIPRLLGENNIESMIPIYCDMRIGTNGIMSLVKRLEELQERVPDDDYEQNLKNGIEMEKLIKEHVKVDVDLITDEELKNQFEKQLDSDP